MITNKDYLMLLDEQKSFEHPLMTKISSNHRFIVRCSDTLCFWVICDTQIFHCRENESGCKVIMFVSGILLCFQDIPGYFHTSTMFWGPLFACEMAVSTWKANNLINNGSVFILGYGPHSAGARPLWVLEKHLLYDSCPSLLQFLSSGDLDVSVLPASRPFCIFVQDCCFVAFAWFRFPDNCSMAIVCPLGERGAAFSHTRSCSGSPGKNSPHPPISGNNTRGTWACLISWTVQEVPMTTRASSFLQLCWVIREKEESEQ